MSIRRDGDAVIRDPFDPAAPGDYAAPAEAARAALETLAGSGDKLFDPRHPGPLDAYHLLERRDEADRTIVVLRHRTLEHCLELTLRVRPVGDDPAARHGAAEVLATLAAPTVMYDPQDRGAFESYVLVERRVEDGFTVLRVRHRRHPHEVEVAIRVMPLPPERAYRYALDQDEVWRKNGAVVFDERHPREAT